MEGVRMKKGSYGWVLLCFSGFALLLVSSAYARDYYIDFELGSDSNAGTSEALAWKHCPGDNSAQGTPASVNIQPGDRLLFRGGVVYRGTFLVKSGVSGQPVVYLGDAWGSTQAIIDGSDLFAPVWTKYNDHLYVADVPSDITVFSGLYENDDFLWYSQDPNPSDPFFWDRFTEYRTIPHNSSTIYQTRTTITDPSYFTQADPGYWNGAYVAVWRIPNVVVTKRITGYNPATHTVTHEDLGNDIYTDRNSYYAVLNHIDLIDQPGEYAINESAHRIYLYPRGDISGNSYSVQARSTGIQINNRKDVVVEGFTIRNAVFGINTGGNRGGTGSVFRGNHIQHLRSNDWYSLQVNGDNILIEDNDIVSNQRSIGILASGWNITVRNNYVERCSRQGIWFMGAHESSIINNTVRGPGGAHANGISVYLNSTDTLIADNRIHDLVSAMTYEEGDGFAFYNNIIYDGGPMNSWGDDTNAVFVNNIFSGPVNTPRAAVFVNNIVHGGGSGVVRNNNIYTDLAWWQDSRDNWSLGSGEIHEEDLAKIFSGSYGSPLFNGSRAVDTGMKALQYLPTARFPTFDFRRDIDGNLRPVGAAWDIGAYEYVADGVCTPVNDADISPCDGCVTTNELTAYIARWKQSSTDVTTRQLMEAITEWKNG
jgi:parallel beta-helix repeat protein